MRKIKFKTAVLALTLSTLCCLNGFAAEWSKNDDGSWCYYTDDGSLAKDAWVLSGNEWFYVDEDGNLGKNQLVYDNDDIYYVDENGVMAVNKWVKYNNKDYYAGENGAFLRSTTTPDGYYVDSDGVWDQGAKIESDVTTDEDKQLAIKTMKHLLNDLKDPESIKVYSVICESVISNAKKWKGSELRMAVIKYSATNSFGGRVTSYCSGYYRPDDTFYIDYNFGSMSPKTLSGAYDIKKLDSKEIFEEGYKKFLEQY